VVIEKVSLYRLKVPLKQPYKIASAEMKAFDCTIVNLQSGSLEGIGEAMSDVSGYFWEKPDEVWQFAQEKGKDLLGSTLSRAHDSMAPFKTNQPCATTPFLTAIEILSESPILKPPAQETSVPMVGILQANDPEGIEKEISDFIFSGYPVLKVKVGFDVDRDIVRVRMAQQVLKGRALLRADANQGYNLAQARKFVNQIDPLGIEFLEQPFPEKEWEAMAELSKISPIPLGLDESIYGMESVKKARQLKCARFVKFKLMKIGSAEALVENIEKSREYGFEVILGNGAAGEISCYHEALVASRTATRAGEMNGFLKQKESILREGLKMEGAKILLGPHFSVKLDEQKVAQYAIDRMIFE